MRYLIDLIESVLPTLYHGSHTEFPVGMELLPQVAGYVSFEDHDEQHHMLERVMEKYRPAHCVSRYKAVFLIAEPEYIDSAGGYDDFVYEVEPNGPVTKCNLAWYTEAYSICEHEVLSQQEAKAQGLEWYPDWEEDDLIKAAKNYWNAVPKDDGDLYEYLTPSATITRIVE